MTPSVLHVDSVPCLACVLAALKRLVLLLIANLRPGPLATCRSKPEAAPLVLGKADCYRSLYEHPHMYSRITTVPME
jgi:hypothetical protein